MLTDSDKEGRNREDIGICGFKTFPKMSIDTYGFAKRSG